MLDFQSFPPLAESPHGAMVRIITSDGAIYDVPEKHLGLAYAADPELRLIPSNDFNQLLLTGEDCTFLWSIGVEI